MCCCSAAMAVLCRKPPAKHGKPGYENIWSGQYVRRWAQSQRRCHAPTLCPAALLRALLPPHAQVSACRALAAMCCNAPATVLQRLVPHVLQGELASPSCRMFRIHHKVSEVA